MACGLARSEGLEPPAFRSVDARTGVRDCSDQSVTWGSPPPVVQVSSEHPKGAHPRGSQIPLPELVPPLVGGLPGDTEPGADLGPGVPAAAQALDCLGHGGVQLVREAGHEDECFHVATGEVLPTWDQALDELGDQPYHVARFGDRFDAQGVLAGSKDATRCIGYLTKYLTKQVGDCHHVETDPQRAHAVRLADALRFQPCSPTCANWLQYGIQPKKARPGLVPGRCKGKAHDADHLGYAGRRVLVSRKWSGKTLADHRADRQEWLLSMLGVSATDPARYTETSGPHC